MKNFNIGKKLYRSSALFQFKLVFLLIALWVLANLYFKTFSDPDFIAHGWSSMADVVKFHIMYPVQVLGYALGTLTPAIYFAFFRDIVFFEKGFVVNKGLPFFNQSIKYIDIETFKIIHPKYLMSVKRKSLDEEILFTVKDIDRVVAIFDQQGIHGDLGKPIDPNSKSFNRKIAMFAIGFGIVWSILQYSGAIIEINRYFFR